MGSSERPLEGKPLEDAELVDLARDGDVPAYEELVSRYQGIAYRARRGRRRMPCKRPS